MTLREAVIQVLREEGRPLHYREIVERLRAKGVWQEAKDPETLARVSLSVLARWHRSPVVALGRGFYALREEGQAPGP